MEIKRRQKARPSITLMMGISLILVMLISPGLSTAGEYRLLKGKPYKLCMEYGKNLNTFKEPMVCNQHLNPEMKEFREIKWLEIDISENRNLVKDVALFPTYRRPERFTPARIRKREEWAQKLINEKGIQLYFSRFDVDNDLKKELVLKAVFKPGQAYSCSPVTDFSRIEEIKSDYYPQLFIMKDKKHMDIKFTENLNFLLFNPFTFQGRTFLSSWDSSARTLKNFNAGKTLGGIVVYEPKIYAPEGDKENGSIIMTHVCTYEYLR